MGSAPSSSAVAAHPAVYPILSQVINIVAAALIEMCTSNAENNRNKHDDRDLDDSPFGRRYD